MSKLPFLSCLCPTFRRPALLRQSIDLFVSQVYPTSRCELVILDDSERSSREVRSAGNVRYNWQSRRSPTLPEKYTELAGLAQLGDALAIWEDDDTYLPDYLMRHALALVGSDWSKPSEVLSDYADPPNWGLERADGRFFSSIVFRRSLYQRVGGFVLTPRADFDQQFIARLATAALPGDPCQFGEPQYVYRWHTGHVHGQSYMSGPDDVTWYERAGGPIPAPGTSAPGPDNTPRMGAG